LRGPTSKGKGGDGREGKGEGGKGGKGERRIEGQRGLPYHFLELPPPMVIMSMGVSK